ncbi:MAG: DegT/DnrJ/EryC1/StrS family aminotransferase [Ignavibacteriaceae bacterium]|jgi:perosamine synthetase
MIPISKPSITEKEINYVEDAVTSGWVSSLGPFVEEFETMFAQYCGCKHAITVANGTVGLHLALMSYDIGAGDEVIVPDLTFVATANAVRYTGATPILVDIESETLCIDVNKIESAITKDTKAIMPVHLYGHPANMEAIRFIADKYGLVIIEDAAEALGATIGGKNVGSFGNIGVFSFYGNKIITTGEGGMLVLNDDLLNDRARLLRDHAMSKTKRYWHESVGYNYRMTNIQAALGVAQLERIEEILLKRRQIFEWYSLRLAKNPNITLNRTKKGYINCYWLICIELLNEFSGVRDELIEYLKKADIDSRPYFYPLSSLPMYKSHNCSVSDQVSSRGLNLPTFFDITEEEVDIVANTILTFLSKS